MEKMISKAEARRFLLLKQGLLGDYKFQGKQGIMDYIAQAGCIQFDPVDVCGQNAQLVLQSRVKNFRKQELWDLLYKDRLLIDYFDKNMAIVQTGDWKCFSRTRDLYREQVRSKADIERVSQYVKDQAHKKGFVCSKDLDIEEKVDWYWSSSKLSRVALEALYFQGDLVVHHKKGTLKYYSVAENVLPAEILEAEDPHKEKADFYRWTVERRIGAIGLLWNKASDAWLGLYEFKSKDRISAFRELEEQGRILPIQIEGMEESFYCKVDDLPLLESACIEEKRKQRTELIAPLDCFMWDRKLIKALFGFDYKWEIYTPIAQRKYGHYVLPVISGERFAGRAELIHEKQKELLVVKNIWFDEGVRKTKKLENEIEKMLRRFARFHGCRVIEK